MSNDRLYLAFCALSTALLTFAVVRNRTRKLPLANALLLLIGLIGFEYGCDVMEGGVGGGLSGPTCAAAGIAAGFVAAVLRDKWSSKSRRRDD